MLEISQKNKCNRKNNGEKKKMAKDRAIIFNGDVGWDLDEWYINECGLSLNDFLEY